MNRDDFLLPCGYYFGSHSAGRPLRRTAATIQQHYLQPWGGDNSDPWGEWLGQIERFRSALATLFNADVAGFCPQSNVSSGLVKVAMALPALQAGKPVLLSECDFPSIGFALQQALPLGTAQIRFIPKGEDVADPQVWRKYLDDELALVWISHGFSNSGVQAPLAEVTAMAQAKGILTAIDVAQTAGVIPIDVSALGVDLMFGSCLKWLCAGTGAGFMWIRPQLLPQCQPKDVGWFSHQNPFEFDIHNFRYHDEALRFWGGTPSVLPFVIAAASIEYFNSIGISRIRAHNLQLQQQLIDALGARVVSPHVPSQRSGTVVVHLGRGHSHLVAALPAAQIHADERPLGVRLSPHWYNDNDDVDAVITLVRSL
ncbi:aminotransferase class V-fold PLP-dependent enzyme [Ferrimonas lipolytica]|uniref:Aminotransferase class V-fold PLP-dependent enzyme n=1 Tax=Ferrimonas lipolytica TaxID=2724191 RepID=A0A6H1UH67_9GAMM|nr:aminotransferase class V-fold PLP-dependent enzyme [Ferrimonas lipolytica]QIZ77950.1 aminotransferase class V-fold PLP-dependent enzyme [Ferrimonas lipolytica]